MQRLLDHAGLRRWRQLGTRQIDLEELISHHETAARVAVEQMVAAGEPEVLHCSLLPSAMATRSTSSVGSSSPSTSRNENARIGLRSPRGCSVRKASRVSPFSKARCTAINVS